MHCSLSSTELGTVLPLPSPHLASCLSCQLSVVYHEEKPLFSLKKCNTTQHNTTPRSLGRALFQGRMEYVMLDFTVSWDVKCFPSFRTGLGPLCLCGRPQPLFQKHTASSSGHLLRACRVKFGFWSREHTYCILRTKCRQEHPNDLAGLSSSGMTVAAGGPKM